MALVCVCCLYWPPLWSSCSAHRSPVSPPGEPASLHVLCKERRGPIPTLGCHLGPGHTQSGLWVSHGYLRRLGDLAHFLPPSHSSISLTATEFTQLHLLLLGF